MAAQDNQTAAAQNQTASEAEYCPDFTLILGAEGGSLEDIIEANCTAFRKVESKIDETQSRMRLEIMQGLLGFDEVGLIE